MIIDAYFEIKSLYYLFSGGMRLMLSYPKTPAMALRAIGMHPKYAGYGYTVEILKITKNHPEYTYRLAKAVYPQIMEKFGCTRSALDRNIRFAIERTWENGNQVLLQQLFGAFGTNWIPTNTEFISVLTDLVLHGSIDDLSADPAAEAR